VIFALKLSTDKGVLGFKRSFWQVKGNGYRRRPSHCGSAQKPPAFSGIQYYIRKTPSEEGVFLLLLPVSSRVSPDLRKKLPFSPYFSPLPGRSAGAFVHIE
jgi:hypothetical protein